MKETIKNLKFAWKYAKGQKKNIILYLIFNVLLMIISIIVPIISAQIIIHLTNSELTRLFYLALVIFIVEITRNIIRTFATKNIQIIYRETFTKIQTSLGSEILKINNQTLNKHGSGVFIQRLNVDTSRISDVFGNLIWYLLQIMTSIGIFGAIFIINKVMCLCIIIMVLVIYLIEKKEINTYNENDKEHRKEAEKISGFTSELVRGATDIKMLSAENSFVSALNHKMRTFNQKKYKMQMTERKYEFLTSSVRDLNLFVLLILFVFMISNGYLTVASALVIYNYFPETTNVATNIGYMLKCLKDFNLSSSRIIEIFNSKEFEKEKFGTKHLNHVDGKFEFKKVDFSFGESKVLNNLNFKVNPNETVAFVGKSGAGKTTIFNLLCKMYDADKGEILIDGININELDRKSVRDNITIISQNPYIFNLSIRENLKLVKEDLTEEEMIEACHLACLDEFINNQKDKYDTVVGEGGVTLSGGQRQRLAIARALVQKTEIILFDEATSSLDNETQKEISQAINNLKGEHTILIIAHRLSTIINSDRILVVNNGQIEASGTHEELLKQSVFYRRLYNTELEQKK